MSSATTGIKSSINPARFNKLKPYLAIIRQRLRTTAVLLTLFIGVPALLFAVVAAIMFTTGVWIPGNGSWQGDNFIF